MGSGPKRHRQASGRGTVRIIGGEWRGRKLTVADLPGLRPTGDRARETLFNWLQADIHGARCVDLFAGTGALGFEAASRGASEVTLVERSRQAADNLRESVKMLAADHVRVVEGDGLGWLRDQEAGSFDIVFIDPPFESEFAPEALDSLAAGELLAPGGLVYLESHRLDSPELAAGWVSVREKVLGDVRIQLLKRAVGE